MLLSSCQQQVLLYHCGFLKAITTFVIIDKSKNGPPCEASTVFDSNKPILFHIIAFLKDMSAARRVVSPYDIKPTLITTVARPTASNPH